MHGHSENYSVDLLHPGAMTTFLVTQLATPPPTETQRKAGPTYPTALQTLGVALPMGERSWRCYVDGKWESKSVTAAVPTETDVTVTLTRGAMITPVLT